MSSLTNNLKRGSTEKNKRKNISWDEGVKDHPNRRTKETTELTYEDGGFPDIVAPEITVDSDSNGGGEEADNKVETRVFRPGKDQLKEDEVLDFDPSAYKLYHSMTAQWPCLSFDILRDRLGVGRKRFPVTCYMVAGTQADDPSKTRLKSHAKYSSNNLADYFIQQPDLHLIELPSCLRPPKLTKPLTQSVGGEVTLYGTGNAARTAPAPL